MDWGHMKVIEINVSPAVMGCMMQQWKSSMKIISVRRKMEVIQIVIM